MLEAITSCWDPVLRCVTIGDIDLVPTLEEYDRFLSLASPLSTIFVPLVWPHYRKRLTDLLGLKRPIVEALTWYGSGIGGSMSFDFLYDRFYSLECLVGYRDDFVDLEEGGHPTDVRPSWWPSLVWYCFLHHQELLVLPFSLW